MSWCEVHFGGNCVGKQSSMDVLLPDGDGPFPVLYLLHGLSDDHTIWHRRTRIEMYVEGLPLIVVMPDGHRSFYCNDPRPGGCAYEDHIVRDVVGYVDRTFHTIAAKTGRAIAGLSMGGYGAIMLGLRHPDVFCAAAGHSGSYYFTHAPHPEAPEIDQFADALPPDKYDCFELARKLKQEGAQLHIRFDCGTEDFLLPANRAFHEALEQMQVAHEYAEYPGSHTWDYWDVHIRETIKFVMEHVESPRKGSN